MVICHRKSERGRGKDKATTNEAHLPRDRGMVEGGGDIIDSPIDFTTALTGTA